MNPKRFIIVTYNKYIFLSLVYLRLIYNNKNSITIFSKKKTCESYVTINLLRIIIHDQEFYIHNYKVIAHLALNRHLIGINIYSHH